MFEVLALLLLIGLLALVIWWAATDSPRWPDYDAPTPIEWVRDLFR